MSGSQATGGIAKVLVVGDVATGKTSVIKRYVRNQFTKDYQTTIGVDFALKRCGDITVQLWDIAGQERFSGLSRLFYAHAVAAVIVFDLFNKKSFDNAEKWKKDIDSKVFLPSGERIPVLLLGNKMDLCEDEASVSPAVTDKDIEDFKTEHGFFLASKCSAKTGENIKAACVKLVNKIAENNTSESAKAALKPPEPESETVRLEPYDGKSAEKSGCC